MEAEKHHYHLFSNGEILCFNSLDDGMEAPAKPTLISTVTGLVWDYRTLPSSLMG